jgi:hypothetical protein
MRLPRLHRGPCNGSSFASQALLVTFIWVLKHGELIGRSCLRRFGVLYHSWCGLEFVTRSLADWGMLSIWWCAQRSHFRLQWLLVPPFSHDHSTEALCLLLSHLLLLQPSFGNSFWVMACLRYASTALRKVFLRFGLHLLKICLPHYYIEL